MKTKTTITDAALVEAGFTDETEQAHVRALCEHLGCEPDDLKLESHDHYGLTVYSQGSHEYAIGDDDEADEAAKKNIEDSAWAFNKSFLSGFCDLPEEVFEALQPRCESSNEAVLSLINKSGGLDEFARQAISSDGRGHFMSSYDGEENEVGNFYIYRTN